MDNMILSKAQEELDIEKKKKEDLKAKILNQKILQDEMLEKAQAQKHHTFQAQRHNELKEVKDL